MPRVILLCVVMMTVGAPARADTRTPQAQALALFADSDRAYKAGDFEHAAELLRRAYALYPEPLLLYNLARALESMGDLDGAIAQYQQYLASNAKIDDRAAIERRVGTLREQQRARTRVATPEPARVIVVTAPAVHEHASLVLPIAVATAGAIGVITAAALGASASSLHTTAVGDPVQLSATQEQATAEARARDANVVFAIGGGVLIAGAIWTAIEIHANRRVTDTVAHLRVGPGSIGVAWELP